MNNNLLISKPNKGYGYDALDKSNNLNKMIFLVLNCLLFIQVLITVFLISVTDQCFANKHF